jgi:hypothetical protein
MFTPSRDEARRFLAGAWTKYRNREPLSPMEARVVEIVALHPEYHGLLEAVERHLDRDWTPDGGAVNPFLHLSLHLAVAEQLAIDQPPGIRAAYARLEAARGDAHAALHEVLECLGEAVWQAQRAGGVPDSARYLECLRSRSGDPA